MSATGLPDAFVLPLHPDAQNAASPTDDPALNPGTLWSSARTANSSKALDSRVVYTQRGPVAALVSLGPKAEFDKKAAEAKREAVRRAAGTGVGGVKSVAIGAGVKTVQVDGAADGHAAAVGANLALNFFTLKTKPDANPGKDVVLAPTANTDAKEWARGEVYAGAQILARELMELPANMLTPTKFCERIQAEAAGLANVKIVVRDAAWAEEKGMRTFLSVAKGTNEPPKLLELHYNGAPTSEQPLAFVGKGITFDSGGISLKPPGGMKLMRADMGGAATVCSAALAIAKLKIPVNLVVVTPLTENLPGPSANKPGDVVYAMNGKSVEIDNTDAEGRLVLSDALWYTSTTFKPHTLVDVATLTGSMQVALGEVFSGVFSTSDALWADLHAAGEHEYDRFWRMPFDDEYGPQIWGSNADLCNTGGKPAGNCTAALFLKAFVDGIESKDGQEPELKWAHVDIAGTMEATRPGAYQAKGMTGRPTRALIEFARRLAKVD